MTQLNATTGVKPGSLSLTFSGRQAGKSFMSDVMRNRFKKATECTINGEEWYFVYTSDKEIITWIRSHDSSTFLEETEPLTYLSMFGLTSKMYVAMVLKFS